MDCPTLRSTLATPGVGTLEHRLQGIPVEAKTGTLDGVTNLAGLDALSSVDGELRIIENDNLPEAVIEAFAHRLGH